MKKVLLTAAAVMAFGLMNAQEVKYGAKAGLNLSNLGGDAENTDMKIGFQVGGFAEIKVSEKFSVQPELLFSTQGAKSEYSESDVDYSYTSKETLKLSYLNIPIMAKFYATEKFYVEAGPQIGLLMSAEAESEETETFMGVTESATTTVDMKDFMNSTDFGLGLGFGYNFTENVGAGVRYTAGLSNIYKDAPSGFSVNNSNIAISVAYTF
jgi:hypothetical protein